MFDVRYFMRGSPRARVKVYLVDCDPLFRRDGIYLDTAGDVFTDTLDRAAAHAQSALLLARLLDWPVDVVHAHDAEAVPALLYRRAWYAGRQLPASFQSDLIMKGAVPAWWVFQPGLADRPASPQLDWRW